MVWFTVVIFVVKLSCKSIAYCGRAKAGCGIEVVVGAGVSVGVTVSVTVGMIAEGNTVSVGRTTTGVGAAHETMRKIQIKANSILMVMCECMELIVLDLRLSLNEAEYKTISTLSEYQSKII